MKLKLSHFTGTYPGGFNPLYFLKTHPITIPKISKKKFMMKRYPKTSENPHPKKSWV